MRGVTERGFKGESDEDPCGRVLGAPPLNEAVMSMTKKTYNIKIKSKLKFKENLSWNTRLT